MDTYTSTSYQVSQQLTESYSTSFSMSSLLFSDAIRPHIYAIYGLVRIADEIVDTYRGTDAPQQLDSFEKETAAAVRSGYCSNPIIHAFATTARIYDIDSALITPFFASMRRDLMPLTQLTQKEYDTYIYGSAEVVGLMCLKVFVGADTTNYRKFAPGAQALGRAYQKVNFLRDIASDADTLKRWYFPNSTFAQFDEAAKSAIVADIEKDFVDAKASILTLPLGARRAVATSYAYYHLLLKKISTTPAAELKQTRIRISNAQKLSLLVQARLGVSVL